MEKYKNIILYSNVCSQTKEVKDALIELQIKLRDDSFRKQLNQELLEAIIGLFMAAVNDDREILVETLRCLRNACANCVENQSILLRSNCLETVIELLMQCISIKSDDLNVDNLPIARCILQLLGNCCSGYTSLQDVIWNLILDKLSATLMSEDAKTKDYTCMLAYNCVKDKQERLAALLQSDGCVRRIVEHTVLTHCEWGMFIIEQLLRLPGFLPTSYATFSPDQRLVVLEVLASCLQLRAQTSDEDTGKAAGGVVASDNIMCVVGEFSSALERLLPSLEQVNDLELHLLSTMLNALSEAALMSNYLLELQACDNLTIKCVALLQRLTELSKLDSGQFSRVSKSRVTHESVDSSSGAFGLRGLTVRLIANLCFRNNYLQNKVRELGGLPLIMDQASIDDRNPFITQWTLLAIRNLCEGNEDNQQFVQQMQLKGVANPEELLRNYNLQCDVQDGKLTASTPTKNT